MNVLHPLELVRQIRKISQNPVVGTDVTIVPIVHPSLTLGRHVSSQGLSRVEKVRLNFFFFFFSFVNFFCRSWEVCTKTQIFHSPLVSEKRIEVCVVQDIGAHALFFNFLKKQNNNTDKVPENVPFQLQIFFTVKGAKYLRIICAQKPTTDDRFVWFCCGLVWCDLIWLSVLFLIYFK